jgi:predicted DsbA family dithiol-disulfide isomerase
MIAKNLMKSTVAGLALALTMSAAGAQDASAQVAPAQIADVEGLTFIGQISGLPAWTTPGADFVWLALPDGGIAASFAYDANGKDAASALLGRDPLSIEALLPAVVEAPASGQVLSVDPADLGINVAAEDLAAAAAKDPDAPIATMQQREDGTVDFELPSVAYKAAVNALQDLPEEDRTQMLIDLVNALQPVKTEEAYAAAIAEWQANITAQAMAAADQPKTLEEPAGQTPVEALEVTDEEAFPENDASEDANVTPRPDVALMPPLDDAAAPPVLEAVAPVTADESAAGPAEMTDDEAKAQIATLLDVTRKETLSFSVGNADAPTVYAYIDPMCPFCASAMKAMKPAIDDGTLQLRVILTPLVNKESPSVVAGILSAEDPAAAFMAHELATADGVESSLKTVAFETLDAKTAQGVQANYKVVLGAQLPEIPFFIFNTAEGPQFVVGEQPIDAFAGALNEPAAE